jgi:hypothetical protein
MTDRVSIRAFAKLDGCSESLVRRGIAEGRLPRGEDGKLDAALAGTGWRHGNVGRAHKVRTSSAHSAHTAASSAPLDAPPPEVAALPGEAIEDAADRLVRATTAIPAYAESLAKKEHFLALLRELEYREKDGQLVDLDLARGVVFDEARRVRDAWLNWPARYGALIAADLGLEADRVTEVLGGYVHKQLTFLGEETMLVGTALQAE